ncbi:hypothetical protein SPAN111604_14080 [Sphingomonas antarctica]
MLKGLFSALASFALIAGVGAPAEAKAACRDAKGKFMKCPEKAKAPTRCRNAKGQFAKCGTPGAKPTK